MGIVTEHEFSAILTVLLLYAFGIAANLTCTEQFETMSVSFLLLDTAFQLMLLQFTVHVQTSTSPLLLSMFFSLTSVYKMLTSYNLFRKSLQSAAQISCCF